MCTGNILLNISLTRSIPTSLYNKNSVSLICVPNPPIDSKQDSVKPVCMVIRVRRQRWHKNYLSSLVTTRSELNDDFNSVTMWLIWKTWKRPAAGIRK